MAEPFVVLDVDGLHLVLDESEDAFGGPSACRLDLGNALVARRQSLDECAGIAAVGERFAVGPRQDARAEQTDLSAGVVDVVLAGHLVSAALQQPPECVAVRREPAVADVDRSGRVRRYELDLDALAHAVRRPRSGVSVDAALDDVGQDLVQPRIAQVEVDETGPSQFDALDMGRRRVRQVLDQRCGQLARVAAGALAGGECDVG